MEEKVPFVRVARRQDIKKSGSYSDPDPGGNRSRVCADQWWKGFFSQGRSDSGQSGEDGLLAERYNDTSGDK